MFKILMNNAGSLIIRMPLSEEVMTPQFCDKVDDYETLEYTDTSYNKNMNIHKNLTTTITYSLILKPLLRKKHICHTYVDFTMMIYNRNSLVLTSVLLIY